MTFNLSYIANKELPFKEVEDEAIRFERLSLSEGEVTFLDLEGGEKGATIEAIGSVLFRVDGIAPDGERAHRLWNGDVLTINNSDNLKRFKAISENGSSEMKVTFYGNPPKGIKPNDISNLSLWLDASQIKGKSDREHIEVWEDLSGKGNDAIQSDESKQMRYLTDYLKGNPALAFNNEGKWWMEIPKNNLGNTRLFAGDDDRFTLFIVSRVARSQKGTLLAKTDAERNEKNNPIGRQFQYYFGDAGSHLTPGVHLRYSPQDFKGLGLDDGNVQVQCVSWNGIEATLHSERGSIKLNVNRDDSDYEVANQSIYIGTREGGENTMKGGALAEIIVYDRALSNSERNGIQQYLIDKWVE